MNISIIGTGSVATNLGQLISAAGQQVTYGARDIAAQKARLCSRFACQVETIEVAAEQGAVVIFAVPYAAAQTVAEAVKAELAGKIVVDPTNPLNADWSPLVLGAENSAGEEMQRLLPDAKVVKAFNTIFADVMRPEKSRFGDAKLTTFVCGNHAEANQTIADLADEIGFSPLLVGDIKNARYLEAIAHLNIQVAVGMQGGTDAGFVYFQRYRQ